MPERTYKESDSLDRLLDATELTFVLKSFESLLPLTIRFLDFCVPERKIF